MPHCGSRPHSRRNFTKETTRMRTESLLQNPPHLLQSGGHQLNFTAERLAQIHAFQQELTSSPYSHDLIELALAVATSLSVSRQDETALVWLLVAGAPSSDKTQTIMLLRELPYAYYLDTLTENSFVSGYLDPKTGIPAQDLLRELDGRCLLIKDLTTRFSLREDKVKKILGDLQSIYDGEYTKY